ncbi:MAG TPA: OmpA family protein [Prolixibacteraceae bacterium]|jgi:outer membrane protein OmpA-like peptidoglycan-associated protein/Tol biopolymer transport system component
MKTCLTLVLILFVGWSFGQSYSTSNKKAIKLFEQAKLASNNSLYPKSLQLLQQAIALDPNFLEAYLLNSDMYQEMDSVSLQIQSLEAAIRINASKYTKLYYTLGNACYRSGLYQKAVDSYSKYLEIAGQNGTFISKARQNIVKCTSALDLIKHPVAFNAKNMGTAINSSDDDYWPSFTVDGKTLIFTRLLGAGEPSGKGRTMAQEDFYTSHLIDSQWQPSEPVSSINTTDNEGAQSISPDGKWLFFTACGRNDGMGSCDIYFSRNKGGSWSLPRNAGEPVNSPAWESQPSMSANGQSLFFVSSRKGGKGGMDIWKCNLLGFSEAGSPVWSQAVNLGDSINTPGNENSPFIHPDNKTLYFASDTWPGLGGFDLFYARQNGLDWSKPRNIGYPINSFKDEQGLVVDASGKNAYYSSDRTGSRGRDIYTFEMYADARPTPVSYVKGKVIDADSGEPLCAQVELIDLHEPASVVKSESCSEPGEFLMCLPLGKEYAFTVSKEGYLFYSENFQLKEKTELVDPYILEIKLKKIDIGGSVVLKNVFFNTGSYELLPESKGELQRLIDLLTANKTIRIELQGHTDNVGTEATNLNLSERRAMEVYKYLVTNGIKAERLIAKGYGYSKPISNNDTPEGRSLNRRTEFKITGK